MPFAIFMARHHIHECVKESEEDTDAKKWNHNRSDVDLDYTCGGMHYIWNKDSFGSIGYGIFYGLVYAGGDFRLFCRGCMVWNLGQTTGGTSNEFYRNRKCLGKT